MSVSTTSTVVSEAQMTLSSLKSENYLKPLHTIDELIKQRASELGDEPLIGYPKEGIIDFEEHSARAIDRYTDAAVQALQGLGLQPVVSSQSSVKTLHSPKRKHRTKEARSHLLSAF